MHYTSPSPCCWWWNTECVGVSNRTTAQWHMRTIMILHGPPGGEQDICPCIPAIFRLETQDLQTYWLGYNNVFGDNKYLMSNSKMCDMAPAQLMAAVFFQRQPLNPRSTKYHKTCSSLLLVKAKLHDSVIVLEIKLPRINFVLHNSLNWIWCKWYAEEYHTQVVSPRPSMIRYGMRRIFIRPEKLSKEWHMVSTSLSPQ